MSAMSDKESTGAAGAGGVASLSSSSGVPASSSGLTHEQKKLYASDPSKQIPLALMATEFRLTAAACHPPSAAGRPCKHNLHCFGGLGYQKDGIWDGWTKGKVDGKTAAWMQLLGGNPSERARAPGSRVGLQNMGSTCYLNTLFQFLFMDPIFRAAVYHYEPPLSLPSESKAAKILAPSGDAEKQRAKEEKEKLTAAGIIPLVEPKEPFLHHLQQVFANLEHSQLSYYHPSHIVNALGLDRHEQQDVHEFLNLLVFQLFDLELKQSRNPICRALIPKLFTGQTVHVMEGTTCGHKSERLSEFHDLSSIQIKGKKKLEECLDHYFAPEEMGDRARPDQCWKCGVCNERQVAMRHTYLKDPPPVLILQLGRFEFDFASLSKKKLADAITLPNLIDMAKYIQPTNEATNTTTTSPASGTPAAAAAAAPPLDAVAPEVAAPGAAAPAASSEAMEVDSSAAAAAPSKKPRGGKGKDLPPEVAASFATALAAEAAAAAVQGSSGGKRKRASSPASAPPAPAASASVPRSSLDMLPPPSTGVPATATRNRRGASAAPSKAAEPKWRSKRRKAATSDETGKSIDLTDAMSEDGESDADLRKAMAASLQDQPAQSAPPKPKEKIRAPEPAEARRVIEHVSDITPPRTPEKRPTSAAYDDELPSPLAKQQSLDRYFSSEEASLALIKQIQAEEQAQASSGRGPARRRGLPAKAKAVTVPPLATAAEQEEEEEEEEAPKAPKARKTAKSQTASGAAAKSRGKKPTTSASPVASPGAPSASADSCVKAHDGPDDELVTDSKLDPNGEHVYELVAILLHKGTSANRGHYTAEIKDHETGQWFTFDDQKVTHKAAKKKAASAPALTAAAATSISSSNQECQVEAVPVDAVMADADPAEAPAPEGANNQDTPMVDAAGPAAADDESVQEIDAPAGAAGAPSSPAGMDVDTVAAPPAQPSVAHRGRPKKTVTEPADQRPEGLPREKRQRQPTQVYNVSPVNTPKSSAHKRKKFDELDDEEGGDDEYEEPTAGKKGASKKAGAKGSKKGAAASTGGAAAGGKGKGGSKKKVDGKADVSVGAASTAYILIYRRCRTMQAGWHPFTGEEAQLALDQANGAWVPADGAGPVSVFGSRPASLIRHPIEAQNAQLAADILKYDERLARLTERVAARREEVERVIEADPPCDFKTAEEAIKQATTPSTPPAAEQERKTQGRPRRSAAAAAGGPRVGTDSPPSTPIDLTSVQLGHYISTQWLEAYLSGWVLEPEKTNEKAEKAEGAASGANAEGGDKVAESTKDADGKDEPIEIDDAPTPPNQPMKKDEPEQADGVPSSPSEEKSAEEKLAATTAAAPAAPAVLSPMQQFLISHPDNDDLPWPCDLIAGLDVLRCSHGKLNPTKMQSAKRISCAAWKMLVEANTTWREKEAERKTEQSAMPSIAAAAAAPSDLKSEVKVESRSVSPALSISSHASSSAGGVGAAAAGLPLAPSASASTGVSKCVLATCSLAGLTDADICQECARRSLLGATMLKEQWDKHMEVYQAYVDWNEARREKEEADAEDVVQEGFIVSNAWWRTWKRELDAAAKALGVQPIGSKSGNKVKKPKNEVSDAKLAAQAAKALPTIHTELSATEDIICEHGALGIGNEKNKSKNGTLVPPDIWQRIHELYPSSVAVPFGGFDQSGKLKACDQCQADLSAESAHEKAIKAKLKGEKGKLKFIKNQSQFTDFPTSTKIPLEGKHHLMPTPWARKLYYYFYNADLKGQRPEPMDTKELLCTHGKLLYAPFPEEDRSVLPAVAAAAAAAAGASSSSSGGPPVSPLLASMPASALFSKVHSTPIDVVTICDDAEYQHLREQNWIAGDSRDITFTVRKSSSNVTGDLSSWSSIDVDVDPQPCDDCIQMRLAEEQNIALDFTDEELTLHRLQADEKVEAELNALAARAVTEGRRASARPKKPLRGKDRKPIQITASSEDLVYTIKLKVFEADGTPINHQEIIWIKPDGITAVSLEADRTLRSYGIPPNAELRLKMNEVGTADLFDQMQSKGRVEQGFKGTALSAALGSTLPSSAPPAATPPPAAAPPAPGASNGPTTAAASSPSATPAAASAVAVPAGVVLPPPAVSAASAPAVSASPSAPADTEMKDDESIQLTASDSVASDPPRAREEAEPMELDEPAHGASPVSTPIVSPVRSPSASPSGLLDVLPSADRKPKDDLHLMGIVSDDDDDRESDSSPVLPLAHEPTDKHEEHKQPMRPTRPRRRPTIKQEEKAAHAD